jgi:hypothetical protein
MTQGYYQEHREELLEYNREWMKNHREERRRYKEEYRKEHEEELREYKREYDRANAERIREYRREYRKTHGDQLREYKRCRRLGLPWEKRKPGRPAGYVPAPRAPSAAPPPEAPRPAAPDAAAAREDVPVKARPEREEAMPCPETEAQKKRYHLGPWLRRAPGGPDYMAELEWELEDIFWERRG